MRTLWAALLVYVLCLVQISLGPFGPDLVLLALFVFALHGDRLTTTLFAFFAGLCLDLTAPAYIGANVVAYSALAYGVASLHSLIYRGRWHLLVLVAAGIAARHAIQLLARAEPAALVPIAVSACLTLLLAIPLDRLLSRLFYSQWKTG